MTETPDADYTTTSDCEGDDDSAGDGNEVTFRPDPATTLSQFTNTRKTGQLQVVKMLDPDTDPGRFDLLIDGNVEREAAGHDDGTGPVLVETGDHTVAEEGADGTDPDDYNTTLECFEGEVTVPSEGGVVAVGDGANIACIFINTRKMGQLTVTRSPCPPMRRPVRPPDRGRDARNGRQRHDHRRAGAAYGRVRRGRGRRRRDRPGRLRLVGRVRRRRGGRGRVDGRHGAVRPRRRGQRRGLHVHQHPEPRADHRPQGADLGRSEGGRHLRPQGRRGDRRDRR